MTARHLAILGYGNVGTAIASAARKAGHDVAFAANSANPGAAERHVAATPELAGVAVAEPLAAVGRADLVVVALPFPALDAAIAPLTGALAGIPVVDATNPVGPGLTHALGSRSAAEHLAALAPDAHVVKAFNIYGAENLAGVPSAPGSPAPLMPYAGDDPSAKTVAAGLVADLGWEPLDVGPLSAALDLEHLALLWIRMVRMGGLDGHLVWSALRWTP
jgi:predicted dinucleotide-binding enzyme